MNRFIPFVLTAVGTVAIPAMANAQVTVFGVIDLAGRMVKNEGVGSVTSLASGEGLTSRFGVRGSEDLGGGLSAGFHLESTVHADAGGAGTGSQFWDRRSTVSLASKSLGELRLGRDFSPTYSNWGRYDPFGFVGLGRSGTFISGGPSGPIKSAFGTGPNTLVRSSNGVQYLLPAGLNGLQGGVFVAPGEGGTAAAGLDKFFGVRLGYGTANYEVSAATATTQNDLTGNEKFKDNVIGGFFKFGGTKVSAAWRQFKILSAKQTNLLVGVTMPAGPGAVKLSYNQAKLSGSADGVDIGGNGAGQLAAGYVYNLSKRSSLYATASRVSNDGTSKYTLAGGAPGIVAGGSSSGFEVGMTHSF
ncbi:porin [Piscinibacter sp.]|uniref:porin n=1 Tax=Piscinibacter sp. TaxID=1903157 RepID=UPI002BC15D22|nr:porin [Albitalea sp.]HUG25994.1 porin [Albitalea sp.]